MRGLFSESCADLMSMTLTSWRPHRCTIRAAQQMSPRPCHPWMDCRFKTRRLSGINRPLVIATGGRTGAGDHTGSLPEFDPFAKGAATSSLELRFAGRQIKNPTLVHQL
jgi:hypothetical protein